MATNESPRDNESLATSASDLIDLDDDRATRIQTQNLSITGDGTNISKDGQNKDGHNEDLPPAYQTATAGQQILPLKAAACEKDNTSDMLIAGSGSLALEKLSVLRKAQKSIALNPNEAKGELIEKGATSSLVLAGGVAAGTIAAKNGQPAVAAAAVAAGVGGAASNIAGQAYKMAGRFDKAVQDSEVDAKGNPKPIVHRRSFDYHQGNDDLDTHLLRRDVELQDACEDSY